MMLAPVSSSGRVTTGFPVSSYSISTHVKKWLRLLKLNRKLRGDRVSSPEKETGYTENFLAQ